MSLTTFDDSEIAVARGQGRPTKFTKKLAKEICDRIALGESVCKIVRDDHMPTEMTIYRWVNDDREGFASEYANARVQQAWRYQDQIMDIADDATNDWAKDEDGNEKFDTEHYMRSRLRVDTRKWYLSKVLPKVFGEKQTVEHTGNVGVTVRTMAEPDLNREIAALLARGGVTDVEDESDGE